MCIEAQMHKKTLYTQESSEFFGHTEAQGPE